MKTDTIAQSRRDAKRAWRAANRMMIGRDACMYCRMYANTDTLLGYCHRMSQDLGIPLIECQTRSLYLCDRFMDIRTEEAEDA